MALFNSSKRLRPRGFEYIPRYYDPAREEMDNILRKYKNKGESETTAEEMKQRIRTGLRTRSSSPPGVYRKAQRQSSIRLILIIAFLLTVVFLLLKSEKTLNILDGISQ